jgi:hypothetical protein
MDIEFVRGSWFGCCVNMGPNYFQIFSQRFGSFTLPHGGLDVASLSERCSIVNRCPNMDSWDDFTRFFTLNFLNTRLGSKLRKLCNVLNMLFSVDLKTGLIVEDENGSVLSHYPNAGLCCTSLKCVVSIYAINYKDLSWLAACFYNCFFPLLVNSTSWSMMKDPSSDISMRVVFRV